MLTSCRDNSGGNEPSGESEGASKGLTYVLNSQNDGYIVTGMGSCTDTRVVIPSTYNGLPVMSIASGAFQAVEPPKTETPKEDGGKDKHEKLAFVMSLSPDDALSLVTWLSAEDGTNESAEERPEANITEVVIPDSVMDIGDAAFYGCEALASFEVSNLINLIGTDAFKNTAYYLDESNWTGDALYLEEYLVEVRTTASGEWTVREGTVNIASNAFAGCEGITAVHFPSSLRFVGNMAFLGCRGIKEIDLSISGIQIGMRAFEDCTALTSVRIATDDAPNAPPVKSYIGFGIAQVDEVFMPGGSSDIAFDPTADPNLIYSASIGTDAFNGCTSLTDVRLGSNVGYFGSYVFRGCTALVSIDMSMITAHDPEKAIVTPSNNHRWYMSLPRLFENCTSLKEVKLPKGIQWLKGTFAGCTALTEFNVPNTVKGLKDTFSGCKALQHVVIPDSVIALSDTFEGCISLSEITLPETLVKVGDRTFMGCDALQSLYVPDSVTEIGARAFTDDKGCVVSLGTGVLTVGRDAFLRTYTIVYRGTAAEWEKISFWNFYGGVEFDEEFAGIICADATIIENETVMEHMKGLLLADGTLYGHFRGVTVEVKPGGDYVARSLALEEIEAELQASGTSGWRYVDANDLLTMRRDDGFVTCYDYIMGMVRIELERPQNNNSSTSVRLQGILTADGILYVTVNGFTMMVQDGNIEQSPISYKEISAILTASGAEGWSELSTSKIQKQYGMEMYEAILAFSEALKNGK